MEKNKKRIIIIIAIIISLLLLILPIIFLVRVTFSVVRNVSSGSSKTITNTEEIEKKVSMMQNGGYASSFSTEEGDKTRNLTHIKIWPTINLYHIDEITELTVKNIKVEGNKKGKVVIIKPEHISANLGSYNYIFGPMDDVIQSADMKDSGKTLTYNVVDGVPAFYDEVSASGTSMPYFLIIIKDLGSFNYTAIMESTGHYYSAKVLEYAGVTGDDINITMSFDVEMKFEDGTKYTKRFTGSLDGAAMIRDDGQNLEFTY